jgi:hypothetical protein
MLPGSRGSAGILTGMYRAKVDQILDLDPTWTAGDARMISIILTTLFPVLYIASIDTRFSRQFSTGLAEESGIFGGTVLSWGDKR